MNPLVILPMIVNGMSLPGVDVSWQITECGMVNAFYSPVTHVLTVCSELIDAMPDAVAGAVAHEMGHAIIDQLNIPVGFGSTDTEDAADQLGALYLTLDGHRDWLLDEAYAMAVMAKDQGNVYGDNHSPISERSWTLYCLEDGSEDRPIIDECGTQYRLVKSLWETRLTKALSEDGSK